MGSFDLLRRKLLKAAAALPSALLLGCSPAAEQTHDLIVDENRKPAATDWQLTRVRLDRGDGYRSPWMEGYCSRQSVKAGETLQIMVSANPPAPFEVEVFRMGYYRSRGARLMASLGPFEAKTQPDPPVGKQRLRECRWEPTVELEIPGDWLSGVYLCRLKRRTKSASEAPWQSYAIFIVRDEREADVLFQCSDNTWQAYNRWPDDYSLYTHPRDPSVAGVSVSFDRPYGLYPQIFRNPQSIGSGEFLLWEYPLCYWLEQHGYDVTYCSNSDMIEPAQALRTKVFLSVGHDEYWDLRQYKTALAAVKEGVTQLYLSGNAVHWVSPFEPSSEGRPNRTITRAGPFGEVPAETESRLGPFSVVGPDEGLLMGARNIDPPNGGGDWIVTKPEHWIFEGTGMEKGDRIPGLVGWEYHGNPADLPGLEVVAEGIALHGGVEPAHWTATIHPGLKGKFVFNAATIFWVQGLSSPPGHWVPWSHWTRPHGPDERVQRITRNLLEKALR